MFCSCKGKAVSVSALAMVPASNIWALDSRFVLTCLVMGIKWDEKVPTENFREAYRNILYIKGVDIF